MKGPPVYARGFAKRAMDVVGASLGLLFLLPVLVGLTFLVWRRLGRPVFFRQTRTGLGGRSFEMAKFRSMTDDRDAAGVLLPNAERMTPFGAWLRATSLDELPELWNVLRGDMSLVGPRPLLPSYLEHYSADQARRHEVKPGVTGWAQVRGRNALSWEERFALDVWYVDHASLRLDAQILLRTVQKVVRREGVAPAEGVTMPPFRGEGSRE